MDVKVRCFVILILAALSFLVAYNWQASYTYFIGNRLTPTPPGTSEFEIYRHGYMPPLANDSNKLLVDITAETLYRHQLKIGRYITAYTKLRTQTNHSMDTKTPRRKSHLILWFNKFYWLEMPRQSEVNKVCSYKNCRYTTDRTLIKASSAVIFCIPWCKMDVEGPPLKPAERPANQVWAFWNHESPVTLKIHNWDHLPLWDNTMNWSINYRFSSDIISPVMFLKTRTNTSSRNYSQIFKQKTKMAAWVVSHCITASKREQFAQKLQEHGLSVDVYGTCGTNGTRFRGSPLKMISRDYKFYLALENSMCSDYITEKYFRYYKSDTILVVRGGADYKTLVPDGTYINTADFDSFRDLVDYLHRIAASERLYTNFLKLKDKYISYRERDYVYCQLCAKLNNLEENRRSYESIPSYLETCSKPDDIGRMDK